MEMCALREPRVVGVNPLDTVPSGSHREVVVVGRGGILRPSMTEAERDILEALTTLEAGVVAMKTADPKPDLVPIINRLTALADTLPRASHAQLAHYLVNGSYEKARDWLASRETGQPAGGCGR